MSTVTLLVDFRDALAARIDDLSDNETHLRPNLEHLLHQIEREIPTFRDNETEKEAQSPKQLTLF